MATADILSRTSGDVITQVPDGTQTLSLTEASVVRVNAARTAVVRYELIGNDLILYIQDGSTVTYRSFFLTNAEGLHSELVFEDGVGLLDHAVFAEGVATAAPTVVVPTFAALDTVGPLIAAGSAFALSPLALAGIGVVALGGGIALAAGGGGGGSAGEGDGGATLVVASAPTLNPVTADNIINAADAATDLLLTGTTGSPGAGQSVTVSIGGTLYTGSVDAAGNWSVTIPAATLQALPQGTSTLDIAVTATVDAFGRYSVHYTSSLLGGLLINLNSIVTVSGVDVAGNTASTTTTLLLGSLLPLAATAEAQTLMVAASSDDVYRHQHRGRGDGRER